MAHPSVNSLSSRMASLGVDSGSSLRTGAAGGSHDDKEGHQAERKKIRAAFDLFDRDRKKVVPKESVAH